MSDKWYTYTISAIDHRWEFLPTVEEILTKLVSSEDDKEEYEDKTFRSLSQFLADWEEARTIADYWEGDFVKGPYVFCVPNDLTLSYGFVWKQYNNGLTFVISPVELPHLNEFAH
ncbi:hypothetical protein [Xenorhabdus doucetiae]|uniref:Uncharacterized protein n=1 Tax=Xenorhabdus doucetiae TaxID=351671 RepID=A0A068QP69_9GAMM|nr:hypothetical protein [Xenorhabdus doucetiae]TYO98614.1 hypothetical protein LY16_03295 [Xenorhabdus doucetiae]CDG16802.1 conserved protein of unknown function [Xenorhabdus doucetiae]